MTPRERVLTTLARKEPDKVPKTIIWPGEWFSKKMAPEDTSDYFGIEIRPLHFESSRRELDFTEYLQKLPKDIDIGEISILKTYSEWGYKPDLKEVNPLSEATTIEEIREYKFPDITAEYRYRYLKQEVEELHKKDLAVIAHLPHLGGEIFESAWRLRGFQKLLGDLVYEPELATYLFDQISDMTAHNSLVVAQADADILALDDDVGMPTGMIISPTMWRKLLKPHLAEVIAAAKSVKPEIHIFYHSDGYIEPIIPDLIEIGVDLLHPVQPDVMNPAKLKELYGERLSFIGAIGSASLWQFGSPEDIRGEVKLRIETMRRGGGFIAAPAYDIEASIPWNNVVAFFEAVEDFGYYN